MPRSLLKIEVIIEHDPWYNAHPSLETYIEKVALQTLKEVNKREVNHKFEGHVNILLTSDSSVQELNQLYRGKDSPTNVLSFPQIQETFFALPPNEPIPLGDIALAWETITREAQDKAQPLIEHLTHLIIHGILHLTGYDHINDEEAQTMEALEIYILKIFGINNPYEV